MKIMKAIVKKGEELERISSKNIHSQGIPLLVSPLLLRKKGLGQIDMACFKKEKNQNVVLEVFEIKAHERGISYFQKNRLARSCEFLGEIFQLSVKMKFLFYNPKSSRSSIPSSPSPISSSS